MKQTMKQLLAVALLTVLLLTCAACNAKTPSAADTSATATATATAAEAEGVWSTAVFTEDIGLGTGKTAVEVEVKAEDKSVTFTLHTDKTTLGDALMEQHLIAGEQSEYGLYVKVVNGITADYDKDGHYWALSKGGEALMTGVDTTEIKDGEHYELVYAK